MAFSTTVPYLPTCYVNGKNIVSRIGGIMVSDKAVFFPQSWLANNRVGTMHCEGVYKKV